MMPSPHPSYQGCTTPTRKGTPDMRNQTGHVLARLPTSSEVYHAVEQGILVDLLKSLCRVVHSLVRAKLLRKHTQDTPSQPGQHQPEQHIWQDLSLTTASRQDLSLLQRIATVPRLTRMQRQ